MRVCIKLLTLCGKSQSWHYGNSDEPTTYFPTSGTTIPPPLSLPLCQRNPQHPQRTPRPTTSSSDWFHGVDLLQRLRPSRFRPPYLWRDAKRWLLFVACSAIGGSTNAPIHINAIARHVGVPLEIRDWERIGHEIPLLVNMHPAGQYLGEEYYRAGGLPAVINGSSAADLEVPLRERAPATSFTDVPASKAQSSENLVGFRVQLSQTCRRDRTPADLNSDRRLEVRTDPSEQFYTDGRWQWAHA